jgi:outer membrane protein OmpA-like peptidoglycan-associated protein
MNKLTFRIAWLAVTTTVLSGSANGQNLQPTADSCLVKIQLLSVEKVPYPGRTVVATFQGATKMRPSRTDSLGTAEFRLPKGQTINFEVYDGQLHTGSYPFQTPNNAGLLHFNYAIEEDIFTEDRTDEVFVDSLYSNSASLAANNAFTVAEVHLRNYDNQPLKYQIILFRNERTKTVFLGKTNAQGTFQILLPRNESYQIRLSEKGNRFPLGVLPADVTADAEHIDLDLNHESVFETSKTYGFIEVKTEYSETQVPDLFILKNVYFDFDKASLQTASFPKLNKLAQVLHKNPKIHIEIGGHTDDFGNDAYNQKLSERRALTARNYLIENGIQGKRITWKGYGETTPVKSNSTPEGRQANRRTEIRVTKR